jgi:acetylornithine deacetylase/succinyl-diaminopimelate desuccinylase-like protein
MRQWLWFPMAILLWPAAGGAQVELNEADLREELRSVRAVLDTPAMQRAMAYIDREDARDEIVQEWLSICNAYGPQGDEMFRSRHLYKLFRIYGLENVHIDDERNVIGVRRGTGNGPTVVLNAHHDAVALWPAGQPIQAFTADGRVWCPAASDDLSGTTQLLAVLRAMNAGNIQTRGDVWFVSFTGEEVGSTGVEHFIRGHYPHNLDWRNGDIVLQLHGGGGEGVSTGSGPYIHFTQLRVFTPLDRARWQPHAVDALGKILARVTDEVRDPDVFAWGRTDVPSDALQLNASIIEGNPIHNGTTPQAWVKFDLRAETEERLDQARRDIERIAEEVGREFGPGFGHTYHINMKLGVAGLDGWDKVGNRPARVAAAAGNALYGVTQLIDPRSGCGDCRRSYMGGMPSMSLRGGVRDYGSAGFEVTGRTPLQSEIRRKTAGHDVTESSEIDGIWSGIKHGLLFAVSYAGLADAAASGRDDD